MPEFAVESNGLTKTFPPRVGWRRVQRARGGTRAVRDVTLAVEHGELFGLLGPNGAGKTTLVKMLCTLIEPTSGCATIAGYDLSDGSAIRAVVGLIVSDERSFFWRLSARQNLRFFAAMHGMHGEEAARRVDEALDGVDLLAVGDRRFSDFSTGMRQRMAIARGLLHRPQILFLDEPSRSLDPTATTRLHELILDLMQRRGMTVFLITHDLSEAEKLCHRVAVMDQGRIQAVGSAAELREQLQPHRRYTLFVDNLSSDACRALERLVANLEADPRRLRFDVPEQGDQLTAALDCLRDHNVTIHNVTSQPPTLEEVFTALTQRSAR